MARLRRKLATLYVDMVVDRIDRGGHVCPSVCESRPEQMRAAEHADIHFGDLGSLTSPDHYRR
jgi:hypothetical protein